MTHEQRRRGIVPAGTQATGYAYRAPDVHVRAVGDDGETKLVGYAAVFMRYSQNLGGYVEQIAPTAFDDTLRDHDQIGSYNHDYAQVLGRRSAGTLRFDIDRIGLRYEIDLDPTDPDAVRVAAKVRFGSVLGSSFSFSNRLEDEVWSETDQGMPLVTVNKVRLYEVAPVVWPAYQQTEDDDLAVSLRSLASTSGLPIAELVAAARSGQLADALHQRRGGGPALNLAKARLRLAELSCPVAQI